MKLALLMAPLAFLPLAACQPEQADSADPRVAGIATRPPAAVDLSILQDQHRASSVRYTPSAPATPDNGNAAPAGGGSEPSPQQAPADAPPVPPPPA